MKLGMREIYKGISIAAEDKIKKSLSREGFNVFLGDDRHPYDIYAEKGDDRRIYDIRIGKSKIQERSLCKLQEVARAKKAKLFVTYVEPPRTKQIEYEGIELLLSDYLINNMPNELDILSTHTQIESVSGVDISSILIRNDIIQIKGDACVDVMLLYGSESDRIDGDGDEISDSYDFKFRVNISFGRIIDAYFRFDTEHFYE